MNEDNDCENRFFKFIANVQYLILAGSLFLICIYILNFFSYSIFIIASLVSFFFLGQISRLPVFCIFLIIIGVILYFGWRWQNTIFTRTMEIIANNPQLEETEKHHAIIIAHKNPKNKSGKYHDLDYLIGIDILVKKFQSTEHQVKYKIYEVETREEIIPIICNINATHLWIFGHGNRNYLRFNKKNLCYHDVKNAPKKVFIGQYHCNSLLGKSLADYNKPNFQDVNKWPRMYPLIRFQVKRAMSQLENYNSL